MLNRFFFFIELFSCNDSYALFGVIIRNNVIHIIFQLQIVFATMQDALNINIVHLGLCTNENQRYTVYLLGQTVNIAHIVNKASIMFIIGMPIVLCDERFSNWP